MIDVTFQVIRHGSSEYYDAVKLREEILRRPFGLTFSSQELEDEKDHIQIAGFENGDVVSTCVLVPQGKEFKMQRVAVQQARQSRGIGSRMMDFCEEYARQSGIVIIYCHARDTAVNFYLKNGYIRDGDYFEEDTIPHIKMKKNLALAFKT